MNSDDGDILSPYTIGLSVVIFAAEVLYGTTSFGPAIVFHIGFHILSLWDIVEGTVEEAVVGLTIPMFVAGIVQSIALGHGCHWRLLAVGGVLIAAGTLIGVVFLFVVGKSVWLKRSIGALLLCLWAYRQHEYCRTPMRPRALELLTDDSAIPTDAPSLGAAPDPTRDWHALRSVVLCFSASGFMAGLTGLAGPPLMIFVASHKHELHMVLQICPARTQTQWLHTPRRSRTSTLASRENRTHGARPPR